MIPAKEIIHITDLYAEAIAWASPKSEQEAHELVDFCGIIIATNYQSGRDHFCTEHPDRREDIDREFQERLDATLAISNAFKEALSTENEVNRARVFTRLFHHFGIGD